MSQGDHVLLSRLEKLDLESERPTATSATTTTTAANPANPFTRRRRSKSLSSINFGPSCACRRQSRPPRPAPKRKLLREPVLQLARCPHRRRRKEGLFGGCSRVKERDFRSIVDACERLTLDAASEHYSSSSFQEARPSPPPPPPPKTEACATTSCSHQARLNAVAPPPCDVTIDELASYFETFVHIPKKMSSMAEMMYI